MEHKILSAAVHSREAFEELKTTECDTSFSDKATMVWKEVCNFYEADSSAKSVDRELLTSKMGRKHPKHAEAFASVIRGLEPVSIPNIVDEVIELHKEVIKEQLSAAFASGKETLIEKLLEKYHSYNRGELGDNGKPVELYQSLELADLLTRTSTENRIAILPSTLNDQLDGGAMRGHHVVVFAPTDMGKTLFTFNMAYGFLKQKLKVLYCGNEDPAADMYSRMVWRITGMTKHEITANPVEAQSRLVARGYENFVFASIEPGTPHELRNLIEEVQPDVLIVDQIRNLNMGTKSKVQDLEEAAKMMRNFGREYNLLPVSLTQAADSATNKLVLDRGDIDGSNVGIPGTADLLIGLGATKEWEDQGYRMISLVKNKISGDKTPIKVKFLPAISKVE